LVPGTPEWDTYHHEHEQRYEFFAGRFAGLDVLDAACGIGYGSAILARAGAKSVTGLDIAPEAIAYAKKHYDLPGVGFVEGSAEELTKLGRTFDAVVSFETIEHLPNPARFLQEVRAVLRPGGLFVCSCPNREFGGKPEGYVNPYHLSEMTFEEFTTAFGKDFNRKESYHQSHSPAYLRHLELLGEMDRFAKAVRFSKLLAFENFVRKLFGKERWLVQRPSAALSRAVPGDFVLEPIEMGSKSHVTFILVGHAKP
jgi:2-polyprenyl-3-methyl-5-hydroxy-6-metoxy-1,4-benzoquinol methylase